MSNDPEFDLLAELPAGLGEGVPAAQAADPTYPGVPPAIIDPRTADVYDVLDELSELVESARVVPLSDRVVINRNLALDLLDAVRARLPRAVQEAEEILADRVGVVEDAYREAERLIADAREQAGHIVEAGRAEQARLVATHEVTAAALAQAEALREQAWAESEAIRAEAASTSERMRQETDEYIDSKFAAFETTLAKTLSAVSRGRERLGQRAPQPPH